MAFATVDEYAARAGQTITEGSTLEDPVTAALDDVTDEIRDIVGHDITPAQTGEVIELRGTNQIVLQLPRLNVANVTSVTIDGTAVTDFDLVAGNRLRRYSGWGGDHVTVAVTCDNGLAAAPSHLVGLTCAIARRWVANPTGARSEQIGDEYSVNYGSDTPEAATVTDRERRILRRRYRPWSQP